ncbi:DUF2490 domain-containing protein [Pontibacter silvestris]|uniref:DUF2490 domain-containing protein n=1 Tax=Pontibacter silvestris TaxID=2305183 RepID=A0ABW4WUX8_9BACT|nr:DUF2490 domain-containing protein [Pontibacter silvestris]MCC9137707.1 DUF2490 domain-containing protein [Pontibacter silvestris]
MRYFVAVLLLWLTAYTLKAQSGGKHRSAYWIKYNNELTLSEKWLLTTEAENRRTFSPDRQNQVLARTTISKQITSTLHLGVGLAYNTEYEADAELWVPEWRPHEQVELLLVKNKFQIEQRIRVEQQFIRNTAGDELLEDHSLTLRTRYQLQLIYNFKEKEGEKGNLAVILWDEPYATPAEKMFFNQNRLSLGIRYQPFQKMYLKLSYINRIVQTDPDKYQYWNVLRFTFNHLLEL